MGLHTFRVKQADTLIVEEQLLSVLAGGATEPVDLGGASVRIRMREYGLPTPTLLDETASVISTTQGIVRFVFQSSHTATSGVYQFCWVVIRGGQTETYPRDGYHVLVVEPRIAPAS